MSELESKFSQLVTNGIRKTVNKFREQPLIFFSEMGIHSYLYHCLYCTKFEAKTIDGKIEEEGPTARRFKDKSPSFPQSLLPE